MKLILTIIIFLGLFCETSDESEEKSGACEYFYYSEYYNFITEYCTNTEKEFCTDDDEYFIKGTDCQSEGWTNGCGSGRFVASDDDC